MELNRWNKMGVAFAASLALAGTVGCDDDGKKDETEDGSVVETDAGHDPVDAGHDPVDSSVPPVPTYPAQRVIAFSPGATDQLLGVAWQLDGSGFYGCGAIDDNASTTSDRQIFVARFHPNGVLDTTWGNGGTVRYNVSGVGGRKVESANSIAVQSSGKLVIGGVVDHDPTGALPNDADGFVIRLLADGQLDTTFGANGVRRLNFNDGIAGSGASGVSGADTVYNIALFADDAILVHGSQRTTLLTPNATDPTLPGTPRGDNDWLAMKLTAEGAIDTSWANAAGELDGKFTLDLGLLESGNARTGVVLTGGAILGGGYTTPPGGAAQRPVLFKLLPSGLIDEDFANDGVFNETGILSVAAEAYGAAVQGTSLVTAGYGKDDGTGTNRWLSIRLSATGEIDTDPQYGEAGPVHDRFQSLVFGKGGTARSLVVYPNLQILLVGSGAREIAPTTLPDGGPGPMTQNDAVVGLLTENGALDASFGTGGFLGFDFGGPSDILYASSYSLSPASTDACARRVALVGNKGVSGTVTGANNNDSAVVVLCIAP